ncbi:LamG-like jellyroll fold domain-containing protein, partial [Ligaoa zhengdingensis]
MHRTTNNWKRLSSCLLAAAVCAATWFTPALALPAGTQPREDGPAVSFDFESDELTGAALRGAAKVEDGALVLDGAKGSYLDVEIPDALKSGDSMTISMWVKLDSIGHDTTLMTMGQNQANYAIFVVKNVFNHLRFAMKENGGAEDNIEAAPYPEEGKWSHVAFVQDGANGRLYKDGAEIASSSSLGVRLSSLLAQGGAYIHLGTADVWDDTPVNGRIDDFQIWAGALSAEEIAAQAGADKNPPDLRDVEAAAAALTIEGDLANVTADLALPLSWENGVAISWKSNSPDVITDGGVVSRKASDRTVTLTATLTKGAYSKIKLFIVTVKALELDPFGTDLSYARRSLDFILNNGQTTLPQSGPNGAVIRWEVASGRAEIDADNLVHKADGAAENEPVVLRATVELDGQSESFLYENLILKDRFTGFLMSYFDSSNDTGGIRLGYSYDGVNWIPLKGGEPVVKAEIGTRRLRDPNIFRRKDGTFGIVATQGWDNPEIYAWDTNDLITFTNERLLRIQGVTDEQWAINREKYNFSVCNDEAGSPPGGGSAWAPEAIYDPVVGKYLIYWSDTHSNGGVHAPMMANWTEDFTNETLSDPFILLDDPHNQMIDANIVKENGTYFMTFKNDYRATPGEGSVKKMFEGAVATELGENSFTYQPGALITDMQGNDIEGATTFRNFNDNNLWYMYFDPLSGSPDLAYAVSPALTGPEANWVTHWAYGTPNYKVNSRINHVTVLPVTQSELDALVAAHGVTGLQYQVLDVREPEGVVSVGSGTPLGLLMPLLPATLPVQLDDGGWYDFPVTWSSSDYDPAAQGSYTFAGALSLPDTVNPASAPQNLTATVVVDSSPAASVTSVEVAPPAKLVYDLGEPLSLDGGYLVVHYADGRSGRLPLADEAVSISGFDNSAAVSELTVTAGYSGFTAPFTVSVVAPASITLTPPAKLDYVLGQKLDLAGGSITVHYEDSSRDKTIPLTESGVRIEGFPTQAGDGQLVTVIYGGQRATFAVNVREVAQDELGAVLHYDFNQATDSAVENQVSDAYRGSLKNGASVADGALRLGGGTQYLDVPTGAIADLTGEEVSLSMWVNLSSNENNQTILTVGRDKNDFAVWVTNVLRYGINADGRGEAKADSSQAVPIHRWTHLALVQTGDTVTLYQDGAAVVSRATYRLQEIMKDGSFIRLGGAGVWPDPYTNGSVDDFKVFARALDAQQVEADRLSSYLSLPTWIEAAVQKADSVPVGDQVGEYPAEAVAAYREAIEAAQDALDAGSEPAMQAALDSLKAAGKALDDAQITEPAVDKTALKDLIEAAGQYEEGAYTAASWAALEAALEEANRVMEDKDATAEEVQTASDELQAAIDGLRYELNT